MRIALAGNPNSGKTTLFNAVTGRIEKVGNWAGVTIEKKEGDIKSSLFGGSEKVVAVDLPGAYSMSPYSSEENITRDFVKKENPDVIINIVDATNLSRSLFFTTQLLELGIPVVVALNKNDLNEKKSINIDAEKLSKTLGCPVVKTISTAAKDNGLQKLIETAVSVRGKGQKTFFDLCITDDADEKTVEENDKKRYEQVKTIIKDVETRKTSSHAQTAQDVADRVLANKWLGIPIFAVAIWLIFSISQTYVGVWIADWLVGLLEGAMEAVRGAVAGAGASPFLEALLVDGIIGGVIAVVGFLPLIMVMFFLIALLEDCGYMARVAVVMDRFLRLVGLSGKSIIPMVVGTACGIPGVMATRTIQNPRQRRTTAMLTPFMPCGAKLPVIALFAGAFFAGASWVSTLMYFFAIALIIVAALIIQRITGEKNAKSFFIIELPEYRIPSLWRAFVSMMSRGKAFIIKAGTIILICNAAVFLMQSFNWQGELVAEGMEGTSILATISSPFAFLLIPLGFGAWQLAAAAITGFIAKENVVGTLAVVYGITNFIDTDELALIEGSAASVADTMGISAVAALAYLMFNLFTPPCFACIGAMNAEMDSKKWVWNGIGLQFGVGFVVAFLVYQFGTLFTTGALGVGFVPGLIVTVALALLVAWLVKRGNKMAELKLSK